MKPINTTFFMSALAWLGLISLGTFTSLGHAQDKKTIATPNIYNFNYTSSSFSSFYEASVSVEQDIEEKNKISIDIILKNENFKLQKQEPLLSMKEIFLWPQNLFNNAEVKQETIKSLEANSFAISLQFLYSKDNLYYFKQNTYRIIAPSFTIKGKPVLNDIQKTSQEIVFDPQETKFFEFGINSGDQKFINYLELKIKE